MLELRENLKFPKVCTFMKSLSFSKILECSYPFDLRAAKTMNSKFYPPIVSLPHSSHKFDSWQRGRAGHRFYGSNDQIIVRSNLKMTAVLCSSERHYAMFSSAWWILTTSKFEKNNTKQFKRNLALGSCFMFSASVAALGV